MSGERPIVRRWREGGGDATDRRITELLRQVSDPAPLPDARLEQVAETLARPRPAPRRRLALRWAVAALVLGSGSAVFARHQIARLWETVPAPAAAPAPEHPAASRPRVRSARTPAVAPMPADPPPAAAPMVPPPAPAASVAAVPAATAARVSATEPVPVAEPARATPSPAPRTRLSPAPIAVTEQPALPPAPPVQAPAAAALPPPAPGLGEEARLVRRALEELRHAHDPRTALATLDEHRARFRGGVLRADAELLRVEALLLLDRGADALAILEGVDLAGSPRADELAVTRGELRAARDCGAAIADFDRVLAAAAPRAVAERALRGRAVCLLRLGDGRAEAAMRSYLERFPEGAFAAEARRRLRVP